MKIKRDAIISLRLIVAGIILCSLAYPLLLGGIGRVWKNASRGSPIKYGGKIVGSKLIGQNFTGDSYFHSRPSSLNYKAEQSGSANLGPGNPVLRERIEKDLDKIKTRENYSMGHIPADIVTESGSGLDPHISPESALMQIPRIARITGISRGKLEKIIRDRTEGKLLGVFGQKRVNVLELNLVLKEVLNND